jgi:hypothetical protein
VPRSTTISAADAWFEGREFEAGSTQSDDIAAVVLSPRGKPDA